MSSPHLGSVDSPAAPPPPAVEHALGDEELARAQTVQDMFDLAAPLLTAPLVGRLVSVSGSRDPIDLCADKSSASGQGGAEGVVLGRGKDIPPPFRIDAPRISSRHCVIRVNPVTFVVDVKDTSTNGTFINNKRIPTGTVIELQPGDRLSLTKPAGSEPDADAGDAVDFYFQRFTQVTQMSKLIEDMTCSICRSVYTRPCSVLPCTHVFCAHCISQWVEKGSTTCAECRKEIHKIVPTPKIQQCVDHLLLSRPDLRPSETELAELKKLDTIPPTGRTIKERKRMRVDGDYLGSDMDSDDMEDMGDMEYEDDEDDHQSDAPSGPTSIPLYYGAQSAHILSVGALTGCRECAAPSPIDGFRCPADGPHIVCTACRCRFPERPGCGRAQRCFLCSRPYCHLYYRGASAPTIPTEGDAPAASVSADQSVSDSSNPPAQTNGASQPNGCSAQCDGTAVVQRNLFFPLNEHAISALPTKAFGGNLVEQGILTTYLAAHNISVKVAFENALKDFEEGKLVPDLVSVNGPFTAASPVCERCLDTVAAELFLQYRRALPHSSLPQSVTTRPNCWYGVNCRTQYHNSRHAQNYNHACRQEKRKE